MIQLITNRQDLDAALTPFRLAGKKIGFVPTMGNLHQGHLSLVEIAAETSDCVVVSIFVNPTQFGPNEDFSRYPRTLEADINRLHPTSANIVFAPTSEEMYPLGQSPIVVSAPAFSDILCGAYRPGHFNGVATVVSIFFNIVRPDIAVFGSKDFQQLAVIRTLTQALCFPIKIIAGDTVREKNGLAMSSRNQYLSETEKDKASLLFQILKETALMLQSTAVTLTPSLVAEYQQEKQALLTSKGFRVDYFEIRRQSDLTPPTDLSLPEENDYHLVILVAAYLGQTRLIDNITFTIYPK